MPFGSRLTILIGFHIRVENLLVPAFFELPLGITVLIVEGYLGLPELHLLAILISEPVFVELLPLHLDRFHPGEFVAFGSAGGFNPHLIARFVERVIHLEINVISLPHISNLDILTTAERFVDFLTV